VLQRFEQANLQLHPSKCAFVQCRVQYLDFVLSEKGVAASPEKVKAVHNFPTPKCVKENTNQDRRLENLKAKASLRMAYKAVAKANKKAHRNNKRF